MEEFNQGEWVDMGARGFLWATQLNRRMNPDDLHGQEVSINGRAYTVEGVERRLVVPPQHKGWSIGLLIGHQRDLPKSSPHDPDTP